MHSTSNLNLQHRPPFSLQNIDQALPLLGSNQPLSPTHTTLTSNSVANQEKQKEGVQKGLKGNPSLVGLTSLQYNIGESSLTEAIYNHCVSELEFNDIIKNYIPQIYEEEKEQFQNFHILKETYGKIEFTLTFQFDMTLEQLEISISNSDLLNKYVRLLKVEKMDDKDVSYLPLKSGYIDHQQKLIELNTCGVGRKLKFTFLFNKNIRLLQKDSLKQGGNQGNKMQMTSDKLKNEILPLLNNTDDDIDELDDEVAMISNKKDYMSGEAEIEEKIFTEDIKITFKEETKQITMKETNKKLQQNEDPENTRNFNTLPRNYSDSMSPQNQNNEQLMNGKQSGKEMGCAQQESLQNLESQIFDKSNNKNDWSVKLLARCIKSIRVVGFNCNSIPAITNMTHLMNESFYLKKEKCFSDAQEIDQLVGVLMISNKRFTQASEIFRRIQSNYIKELEDISGIKHNENSNSNNLKNRLKLDLKVPEKNKLYLKCAILELLVVESMCQSSQVNDKLLSIKRMVDFFSGKLKAPVQFQPQIFFSDDPYTTMIKILPQLLKFVMMCMTHRKEPVRLASLKLLEFILETKGCSLDSAMVFILRAILKTYPGILVNNQQMVHQDSFCLSGVSSSDFLMSPRLQSKNELLSEKATFNNTVNLNVKHLGMEQSQITECAQIKEPQSGFIQALKNAYNHVLDTYISVLSSISSHLLHQLFYEVIVQCLNGNSLPSGEGQNQQSVNEIKVFTIKIAEKIITICQGDLILSKQTLDSLLLSVAVKSNSNESLQSNVRNLWQSVRSKVFANYSMKGMKSLIEWLVEKMTVLSQGNSNNSDNPILELSDEETYQLQQVVDIVSLISLGKKKNEEEANNLIKIKQDYCVELYLLINPLLFWLDFSVEREERLNLFKLLYQTVKDVLDSLPPKKVDLDVLQIMIPILQKTTEYLKNNSPSLPMLKFLDLVLRDIKQGNYCVKNPDLQYFFLDMLNNLVPYISYCLYEEVFFVFDKLLSMCSDVINEKVLQRCIVAMVDKFAAKGKAHKNSMSVFMKSLMEVKVTTHKQQQKEMRHNNNNLEEDEGDIDDEQMSIHSKNNYFEILCEFCFFNNEDPSVGGNSNEILRNLRNPIDTHDLYIDKLQFFIDSLAMLNEVHINLFTQLVFSNKFKFTIMGLLQKVETQLRLKCHEILEIVTNYYVQFCTSKTVYELAIPSDNSSGQVRGKQNQVVEVEFINHERLHISQLVINCVKNSLEQKNDSYLQFNSLILLDFLFQNLLPVPTYQNEFLKGKGMNSGKSNQNSSSEKYSKQSQNEISVLDLESMEINEQTVEFEVTDERYLQMRLNLVFKLWPFISHALNSAWSNIRSICYGLICSMLKIDLRDFSTAQKDSHFNVKLKQIVLPMLLSLLSSKESESKAGGLNILGSFCGLSYDFTKVKISKNLDFFKKNSSFVTLGIWQLVFDLQDDWDITIKEASVVLIQLCAPRDAIKYFDKIKREKEGQKLVNILNKYAMTPGGQSQSSSRNQFYMNSGQSNEEEYQLMQQQMIDVSKQQNLISFMSGTDELSMFLQMEQNQNLLDDQKHRVTTNRIQQKLGLLEDTEEHKKASNIVEQYELLEQEIEGVDLDGSSETFSFFVDEYNDEQIQEIISIFRNDFKPPKNLWIEKNPSAAFNSPDYYAEIYSSAIDQFNQQQMQLQQQQQQELQLKVSGSPKAQNNQFVNIMKGNTGVKIDALEDDLVKKFENERNERQQKGEKQNYMIFERHFEEGKQESGVVEKQKEESIDAEPYIILEVDEKEELYVEKADELQIMEQDYIQVENQEKEEVDDQKQRDSKKTDELIEEYERKINKTIQLLEEEKKKNNNSKLEQHDGKKENEDIIDIKTTPDFKQKKILNDQKSKKPQQATYLSELSRGYINNVDNMKLIKQINNVFNDSQLIFNGTQTQKQKLNKSFENLIASHKSNNKTVSQEKGQKKNLSSSPRRGSSSSKKIGSKLSGGYNKKKYIMDQSKNTQNNANNNKALYNMRDLNYFIKTIEKDLSEKFNKMSLKDFNSMPTTPTSILKKVEDQVKAMAQKKETKNYMSNTCPNIAQVLGSLDTAQASKSNQVLQLSNVQNLSHLGKTNTDTIGTSTSHTPIQGGNNIITFGNNQQLSNNFAMYHQQQQNLEKFSFSKTQKIDLSSINKNMFGYGVPTLSLKEEPTQRENSSEHSYNGLKGIKKSPKVETQHSQYTNLMKQNQKAQKQSLSNKNTKRSRGSQDKYGLGGMHIEQSSGSSSQSKLNKSANMISQNSHNMATKLIKKQQISKLFIDSKSSYTQNKNGIPINQLTNHLSPTSQKKSISQINTNPQITQLTTLHQTPMTANNQQSNMFTQQSAHSSNMVHEYMQNTDTTNKKVQINNYVMSSNKTPVKQILRNKGYQQYSEIIDVSPSTGEKEKIINQKYIY